MEIRGGLLIGSFLVLAAGVAAVLTIDAGLAKPTITKTPSMFKISKAVPNKLGEITKVVLMDDRANRILHINKSEFAAARLTADVLKRVRNGDTVPCLLKWDASFIFREAMNVTPVCNWSLMKTG